MPALQLKILGYLYRMQSLLPKLHVLFQPTRVLLLIQVSFLWHVTSQPEHWPPALSPGQLVSKMGCGYTGDTYYCARETAFTGTTATTDFPWKGKKRLLLLFRHNLALCFTSSFWSVISLPFF